MQNDWAKWLYSAQIALNDRPNATGLSPFYITHRYHLSPVDVILVAKAAQPEGKRAEIF